MLINHNTKQYWWGPQRTASRMTSMILKDNGWVEVGGHHYMEYVEGYELWINVRNPFGRAVSFWRQTPNRIEFDKWIRKSNSFWSSLEGRANPMKELKKWDIKHYNLIRYEHLKEDLTKLNLTYREDLLDRLNQGTTPWRKGIQNDIQYQWTEDIIELIWERTKDEQYGYTKHDYKLS